MKNGVKVKMSLPCNQGLNISPLASIQHIVPTYSQGASPAEPISTPVITPGPHNEHEKKTRREEERTTAEPLEREAVRL